MSRFWVVTAAVLGATLLGIGCIHSGPRPFEPDQERVAASMRDVGIDLLNQGRTAMAIRKLSQARIRNPKDPITYQTLGEAYRRKGMLEEAKANLLKSLELNEDSQDYNYQEALLNLSALYIQLGQYEAARQQCEKLVADPTFSTPWRALTNLGWAEFKLGRLGLARTSFEEALDFYPRYPQAHLNLGMLDQREQRWLAAIRHYELAADSSLMAPDGIAQANFHIAEIYVSMGDREKAIAHFGVALERSPYGRWGEQSQSYLELLR
jgi:Tfp pilus assembly protein PilF